MRFADDQRIDGARCHQDIVETRPRRRSPLHQAQCHHRRTAGDRLEERGPVVTAERPAAAELPPPGTCRVDPERSTVSYSGRHLLGLGTVHATFKVSSSVLQVADPVTASTVEVTVDAGSFRSDKARRDKDVRSATFLDVTTYPEIAFRSESLRPDGDGWVLAGSVTAHGTRAGGGAHRAGHAGEREHARAGPSRAPRPLRLRSHQGQGHSRALPRSGPRRGRGPARAEVRGTDPGSTRATGSVPESTLSEAGRQPTSGPVVMPAGSDSGLSLGSSGRGRLKVVNRWPGETGYTLIEASHPVDGPIIRDHVHHRHDETFVVLDGHYRVRIGADVVEAGPGDTIYLPRGTPHTYVNRGPGPARILNIISPADGVELLADLGALSGATVSEAEMTHLMARHHTVPVAPLPGWQPGPAR